MEITSNFVAAVLLIWFNCLKTAEPLGGNSLFFTTGDPGTHSLVVEVVLDSQSRGPMFKTTGWLQGRLSLSSFQGR